MNSIGTRTAVLLASALLMLSMTSCVCIGERVELVDLRTEERTVELDGAERVVIDIDMGIGKLHIAGGSSALLDAEFTYNVDEWTPAVEYGVKNGKGRLSITQPDAKGKSVPDKARNEWELSFGEEVPLELIIDMGVGDAYLDLSDIRLTDLSVDQGVGNVKVNLVGVKTDDLRASLDGGVGEITVTVPSSIGVRVDADTGIGSFNTHGLTKRGDAFVNDAYDNSESTISLSIDAGIGKITVTTEDGTASM
ncbi:MAG: toast rack family protein [Candidatus Eisenbacteria bacterium]|nr:toast rack family protein [Candidatus Eisenbacteria bacterium]